MPDAPWIDLNEQDSANYEKNFEHGQPPDTGFQSWGGDQRVKINPNGSHVETRTDYYVNWTAQPAPKEVRIRCAMCDEHIHTTVGDVPDADQVHASAGYWLERQGLRFKNATVTGTEIKRTSKRFVRADGSELVTLAFWSKRTVNQVKNGIEWEWGDYEFECVDGLPFSGYASLSEMGEMLAMAVADAGMVGADDKPTILLTGFLPLLVSATSVRKPIFHVEAQAGEAQVVVSEKMVAGEVRTVGRQRLAVLPGTAIVSSS